MFTCTCQSNNVINDHVHADNQEIKHYILPSHLAQINFVQNSLNYQQGQLECSWIQHKRKTKHKNEPNIITKFSFSSGWLPSTPSSTTATVIPFPVYPAFQAEITFNVGPWDPSSLFYNPRNEIRSRPDRRFLLYSALSTHTSSCDHFSCHGR